MDTCPLRERLEGISSFLQGRLTVVELDSPAIPFNKFRGLDKSRTHLDVVPSIDFSIINISHK